GRPFKRPALLPVRQEGIGTAIGRRRLGALAGASGLDGLQQSRNMGPPACCLAPPWDRTRGWPASTNCSEPVRAGGLRGLGGTFRRRRSSGELGELKVGSAKTPRP